MGSTAVLALAIAPAVVVGQQVNHTSGTGSNSATIDSLRVQSGTYTNTPVGVVTTSVLVQGGTLENAGDAGSAGTVVTGSGILDNQAGGVVGSLRVDGTATVTNEGEIGSVTQVAGDVTNRVGGQVTGTTTIGANTTLDNLGTLGDVSVSRDGTLTNRPGATTGPVTVQGTVTNNGTVDGGRIAGGTFDNLAASGSITGTISVEGGGTLNNAGTADNVDVIRTGTLENTGRVLSLVDSAGTTNNRGRLEDVTVTFGGTVTNVDDGTDRGVIEGAVTVEQGLLVNQGVLDSNTTTIERNGTFRNEAGGTAARVVSRGTGTNEGDDGTGAVGTIDRLTVERGTFENFGVITGNASNDGGALTIGADGSVGGTLRSTGRTTVLGTVTGETIVQSGPLDTGSAATLQGDVAVRSSGRLTHEGTIAGDLRSAGQTVVDGGTVNGTLTVADGRTDLSGTVSNTITVNNGANLDIEGDLDGVTGLQNDGRTTVLNGTTSMASGADVTNNGTFVIGSGTTTAAPGTATTSARLGGDGTFTNQTGQSLTVEDGFRLDMTLENRGTAVIAGRAGRPSAGASDVAVRNFGGAAMSLSGRIDGSLRNYSDAVLDIVGTNARITDELRNDEGSTITIETGERLRVDNGVNNRGVMIVNGRLAGDFRNVGTLPNDPATGLPESERLLLSDGVIIGNVTDTTQASLGAASAIRALGASTINGNVLLSGEPGAGATGATAFASSNEASAGSVLDLTGDGAGTRLTIDGDATINGIVGLDVDFGNENLGTAGNADFDSISVTGQLDGAITLAFENLSGEDFAEFTSGVDIVEYGSSGAALDFSILSGNLPTTGSTIYTLNDTGSAVTLRAEANPGVGALAGGVALTQSLIGTVVNRPSPPLAATLTDTSEGACATGGWGRLTGGRAEADAETTNASGTYANSVEANYAGFQAGSDFGCADGYFGGWNMLFGTAFGANQGNTEQPVFRFETLPGGTGRIDFSTQTSVTKTDFQQVYAGIYANASRGPLSASLQYRFENTAYEVENEALPGGGRLGVEDQEYFSNGHTVAGQVQYSIRLGESGLTSLLPAAGFSFNNTEVDDIRFDNRPGAADDQILEIADIESRVGFTGLTLARVQPLASGNSVLGFSGSVFYYEDFNEGTTARLYDSTKSVAAAEIENTGLGAYSEVSLGLLYQSFLDEGSALPGREFFANVRLEGRFSDTLDSWGLTAQARINF